MSPRFTGVIIAILGASGVVLGAFGAHALKDQLASSGHLDGWRTAVSYQLIHAVAALALWAQRQTWENARSASLWRAAVSSWLAGTVLFSGSIYVLSLGGPRWLGPITPLGGLAMIAGWLCLLTAIYKTKS